jgi:hypothetical protein
MGIAKGVRFSGAPLNGAFYEFVNIRRSSLIHFVLFVCFVVRQESKPAWNLAGTKRRGVPLI